MSAGAGGGRTGVGRLPASGDGRDPATVARHTKGATVARSITSAALSDPCAMLGPVETRSVSPVFVGRTDELGVLHDALARAVTGGASQALSTGGEPQALLLGGEAGVGKTRLLEEFATAAVREGAVFV